MELFSSDEAVGQDIFTARIQNELLENKISEDELNRFEFNTD